MGHQPVSNLRTLSKIQADTILVVLVSALAISNLSLLKVHLPYHESDHVLNVAYNILCGGNRLEDIERLRHDVASMNALGADLIPDPTTAGAFTRRLTEADVLTLLLPHTPRICMRGDTDFSLTKHFDQETLGELPLSPLDDIMISQRRFLWHNLSSATWKKK